MLEGDELAVDEARVTPGVLGEHQGEQPADLVLVGHQLHEQPAEADGLLGELGSRRAGVPLREDQVDHGEHAVEPLGKVRRLGDPVGDAGVGDPLLGAQQPLAHRRLADQEHPGHLLGRQPRDDLERERDPRLHRQRWMAAGEDEPEPVVGDGTVVHCGLLHLLVQLLLDTQLGELGAFGAGPPDHVERAALRGGREPGRRVAGNAVARPGQQRALGGVGDSVLGEVPVAGRADQRRDDAEALSGHRGRERLAHVVATRQRGAAPAGRRPPSGARRPP